MKKIALIIAAIMLISLASVFCASAAGETAVWDGTVATSFAGGNGSKASPYQIATAGQWAYFSTYAPSNPGKYYQLTADITFNKGDATTWGESFDGIDMTPYIVGSWYTPDGDPVPGNAGVDKAPFVGTFDGNGHTISGVYMFKATSGDPKNKNDTVALFGSTAYGADASIKNLLITNSYFEAEDGVAAACVGQAEGGTTTIKNVYVTDTVKIVAANSYAGGVMAHLGQGKFKVPSAIIDSCVNAASVTATSSKGTSVAGILGNGNQKIVSITNCLNMGDISGYNSVGGILGFGKVDRESTSSDPTSSVSVSNCINTGKIVASSGKSCSIVSFDKSSADATLAENCYYVSGTADFGVGAAGKEGAGATAVTISELCRSSLIDGLDSEAWVARGNDKASPKTYDICMPKGVIAFSPKTTAYYKTYDVPAWLANYNSTSVFEINSVEKFQQLTNFINGKYVETGDFSGKTVKLTADITFNEGSASTWETEAPANDMTAYMIGNWGNSFSGTFDGNGKTISGFYAKSANEGVGLFGATANGKTATIKNLVITNSYFEGAGCVGALVGQTHGGSTNVSGIYVTDSVYIVSSGDGVGGIIGHVGAGSFENTEIIVNGCVNEGTVRAADKNGKNGKNYVGGIVGNGNGQKVTINNCLNLGSVSGLRYVSGILGYNASKEKEVSIKACVNLSKIESTTSQDAGKSCAIACFGGDSKATGIVENCLFIKNCAAFAAYKKGSVADGLTALNSGSDLIGSSIVSFIFKNISEGWTAREGLVVIPNEVKDFAPASSYSGGEIETEPVDPETQKQPETGNQPETGKPADETKKPVETAAPAQDGGCGGFTVVATAILVAVAGFSTAIVIKQR